MTKLDVAMRVLKLKQRELSFDDFGSAEGMADRMAAHAQIGEAIALLSNWPLYERLVEDAKAAHKIIIRSESVMELHEINALDGVWDALKAIEEGK